MRKPRTHRSSLALALAGLFLALPGAASAAPTVFGSPFTNNPSEAPCSGSGTCTILSYIVPEVGTGNPYSGGAPVTGVITKFRVKAETPTGQPGTVTFRVGNLTPGSMGTETTGAVTASGPTVSIPEETGGEAPVTEASARVPVKKGQYLGVDASETVSVVHASSGEKASFVFEPPLADGAAPRAATETTEELLVQAVIEPDADNDGFGDETQDQCPTQASTQGPCDNTAPVVGNAKVSGGVLSYVLSEAATVSLQLERKSPGRKVGRKCVAQTKKNKSHARCPLFKKVGAAFSGGGAAGPNRVTLPNGKKLKPGSYRVTITATDAAGNTSVSTSSFTVKPKRPKRH